MAGLFGAVSSNLALEQCFAHSVRPEWSTRRPEDVGRFSKVDVPGEPSSFYQSHRYPNGVYGRTDSTRFGASASRRLRDSESASGANLIATATSTKPMKLPTVDSIFGLSTAYDDDYQPQGFTRGPPFSECQETRDQFLPDSTFQLQKAPITMAEDVAMTATTLLNNVGAQTSHFGEFKKDWGSANGQSTQNGGQMMTLSPPAGDGAGAAATQPEATSSQAAADISGDAEGVWSIDIDQAFQEAMAIYPPCGRRKIIISDEGKMYGRNELIARYIKLRCGKTRTRKQVSSHIQVLARKKLRDEQAKKKTRFQSEAGLNSPVPSMATPTATTSSHAARPSSAAAVTPLPPPPSSSGSSSASASTPSPRIPNLPPLVPSLTAPLKVEPSSEQFSQQLFLNGLSPHLWNISQHPSSIPAHLPFSVDLARLVVPKAEASEVRPIASSSLSLLSFTAYVLSNMTSRRTELLKMDNSLEEDVLPISMFTDKYPPVLRELFDNSPSKDQFFLAKCWANLDFVEDIRNSQYAVDSYYSSPHKVHLKVSTMACSFAKKVVEKIEAYPPTEAVAGGGYSFALKASPMCDYMVQFISELKKLENVDYMNSVLENFTILQVVTNNETDETLMVMCFVFDVSRDPESSCSVFRLGV